MGRYVLELGEIDQSQIAEVGGKGAHLGELSQIEGIHVPAGGALFVPVVRVLAVEGDEVTLETIDALKPAVVRSVENQDYLYLLMPVRVS